ncbi:MAG TPA: potassium channel protein [Thermodesulfobacteriota bacterium]|nr:potassium channel protein [Thermodesulfobacteriota bacterium]
MDKFWQKLIQVLSLVILITAFGTAGYMAVEGWNFLDSLYMTIITISTAGFREVHELSPKGMIFTIVLIIGGVGTALIAFTAGARFILEGEIREIYGRKKLEKKIRELRDHYIICGYGRMGRIIAKELQEEGVQCVVVEKNPTALEEKEEILALIGDATRDHTLREAGIEKACGLISVLPNDAENLFAVLSARGLNPNILIVARAIEEGSEQKLLRAGATKVVSPYLIGGLRMAHTVLKPTVVDFIEFTTRSGNLELQMQEVTIQEGSRLIGMSLESCSVGDDLGVIVVAIKQATGETRFNPTHQSVIKAGDILIVLGEISKLKRFEEMAKPQ